MDKTTLAAELTEKCAKRGEFAKSGREDAAREAAVHERMYRLFLLEAEVRELRKILGFRAEKYYLFFYLYSPP
jgi:hypothetical protein